MTEWIVLPAGRASVLVAAARDTHHRCERPQQRTTYVSHPLQLALPFVVWLLPAMI